MQDEFLRIKSEINKTIVFVTHDIDEAIKIGDRVCVLNAGAVQQFDTPEALLRAPVNDFVASFLGEDRELKRLSLMPVTALMRIPSSETLEARASILASSSARDALSQLMGASGRELTVIDEAGRAVGLIAMSDYGRNP